ncbi:hypothetical protein DSO57_1028184 [Entomophthora muscae]|uniref:Uncharacterized protein n=1 Tax=Entomophthora muscae TaxID=34485 RepID=A0ACC2RG97_9FUNG|nr:hypothetical protein DSO57_1028184 [Entomophthora muscae]
MVVGGMTIKCCPIKLPPWRQSSSKLCHRKVTAIIVKGKIKNEAKTPKEIDDIEVIIAATNQRIHQQVLNDDKQWAVPALPRPFPKISENVKAPEKLTKAVAVLVPHHREKPLLSSKGASRAKGAINGVETSMILDGSTYSNIISLPFLKMLPNMMIAPPIQYLSWPTVARASAWALQYT